MDSKVQALNFQQFNVGKNIKKSKKRFVYTLRINEKQHTIEIFNSLLSGKIKILHNGKEVYHRKQMMVTGLNFSLQISGNALYILQQGDNFEIRINNQLFSHLYL